MKTAILLAAGLALSAAASTAAPARLALWIADPIGATSASQCNLAATPAGGAIFLSTELTLTEKDVSAWSADTARWTLDPASFPAKDIWKLQDHCFVLAIDGKRISSGVILASHSARLIDFPLISVDIRNDALDLQLTAGNQGGHRQAILVDLLDTALDRRANLEWQLQRVNANEERNACLLDREWTAAVRQLIERNKIREGMPVAEMIRYLGPPSRVIDSDEGKIYRWYFNTRAHVNSLFSVRTDGGIVRKYSLGRG